MFTRDCCHSFRYIKYRNNVLYHNLWKVSVFFSFSVGGSLNWISRGNWTSSLWTDVMLLQSYFSLLLICRYTLDNLKFGKINVGRYPDAAKHYHINDSSLSLQLPTISVFKKGKEVERRPCLNARARFQKFYFTEVSRLFFSSVVIFLHALNTLLICHITRICISQKAQFVSWSSFQIWIPCWIFSGTTVYWIFSECEVRVVYNIV